MDEHGEHRWMSMEGSVCEEEGAWKLGGSEYLSELRVGDSGGGCCCGSLQPTRSHGLKHTLE